MEQTKLICLFCNAQYSTKMEQDFVFTGIACETCGPTREYTGVIEIFCDNCKRLVYRKEGITIY